MMKIKNVLLLAFGILLSIPTFARDFQYTYKGQTLWYTVISEYHKTCMPREGFDKGNDDPAAGNFVYGDLVIPEYADGFKVVAISKSAFEGCDLMTSVTIPKSVTEIGDRAFLKCRITSVNIPNSVTKIGRWAFCLCEDLTSLTIPNSVTEIGPKAFEKCRSLTSVYIPNTVTELGYGAFYDCTSLTSINIPTSIKSIPILFIARCSSVTSVTIPNSVTRIEEQAFKDCSSLASVTIPNSVVEIEPSVFEDCSSLTYVEIPNSVKNIGSYCFARCSSLTSITLPNSITHIGGSAFEGCTNLISIVIPQTISFIGNRCFYDTNLTAVYYDTDKPIISSGYSDAFSAFTYDNASLYVPESAISLFKEKCPWMYFKNIVAFDFSSLDEVSVDFDEDVPCEIYNSKGLKVSNTTEGLAPGFYIRKQGARTEKFIVK